MKICKTFKFSAAHQLPNVPAGHPCGRLHGHNYRIDVYIEGSHKNEMGWVLDFADIGDVFKPMIDELMDHHFLNEFLENPTSENFAVWVLEKIPMACAVRVWETDTCYAEATRADI